MLQFIITFALQRRVWVLLAAVALLTLGWRAARETPLDVFPEFARPLVEVQTEAPGLSTPEVEALITVPIEAALSGVPGLETQRSKSVLGLSSVVLFFRDGTDLLRARQLVQERLAIEANRLPHLARPPVILPSFSSMSRALKIGVTSAKLSRLDLSDLVRFTIRPRLLAIPGVANVSVWGQRDRQLHILADPARLRAHGLTLNALQSAITDATALAAGGFLDTAQQRIPLRHSAIADDPATLAEQPVPLRGGATLHLGDVATLSEGHAPPIGDAVIGSLRGTQGGLLLIVEKQPAANTLDVTHRVESALQELRPALADVDIDSSIFRPAGFIEQSLHNLQTAIAIGCILVVAVLLFFLRDLRAAIISLIAIPLSLTAAVVLLWLRGGTLNTLFLAGLVIALGEVVDDAVIDVENIRRRLRTACADTSASPLTIVLAASLEVRSAVVFSTLIVCLVCLPVLLLDGLAGAFFRPLALAYLLAVLASLIVALTVTPALCLWLLPQRSPSSGAPSPEPALIARLRRAYLVLLPRILAHPRRVVLLLVGVTVLPMLAVPFLREEFLPSFQERNFLMHWIERPGTSVEASRRSTEQIGRELLRIPGVQSFGAHIGRAEVGDEVVGPNFTEHWISIDPRADYTSTVRRIEAVVAAYPGVFSDVLTYLKERIKEVLSGTSSAIVVRIYGPDLDRLRSEANAIAAELSSIPGLIDLKVEPQINVPQIEVRLRPERAALYGLTAASVRRAIQVFVAGQRIGEVYPNGRSVDVLLWTPSLVRADLSALRRLLIDTPSGEVVEIGALAELRVVPAPNEIKRESGSRRLDVTCNVRGRALSSVARDIEARVAAHTFPRGTYPQILGEYAAQRSSRNQLALFSLLALAGIFGVLYLDFRSLRQSLLLFATLPFALVGGLCGALLAGGVLSLGSFVGFVSVLGIAARNGIMLLSHYRHLRCEEGVPWGSTLFLRGASERLLPILMTALCAGLALLPIVLRGNVPGYEIEFPMAAVILGGLASSTLLNLLFVPALYAAYGEPASSRHPGEET
ncbi:MAG: efflux RND transporter permease subunit [Myxococcales bacterium]|nr:efflux RND transporter permease subunit [Myxococcales bacterium]